MAASHRKEIVIKSSSTSQKAALIEAELEGKPVELTCILTASACKAPAKGRYLAALLSKDEGEYEDCTSIGVYKIATNGETGEKVGNFCLLSEWGND